MAKFKISDVFEITNRGYVLSGEIVDGEIAAGKSIHIGLKESININSVEYVNFKNVKSEIGLMIGIKRGMTFDQLKDLIGQTVSIA
jgi:hypothetical protein